MQLVGVGLLGEDRSAVVVGESGLDRVDVVGEVQHECVVLFRMRAVETGQRLHRFDARQRLVHVHGVQQGFVVAGLKFVGADQETVRVLLKPGGDHVGREAIEGGLGDLRPCIVVLAGEGDDGAVRTLALDKIGADGVVVADGAGGCCS